MTQVLFIVGIFVFFITVGGAVMVGGYLLEELERAQATPEPAPAAARSAGAAGPTTASS